MKLVVVRTALSYIEIIDWRAESNNPKSTYRRMTGPLPEKGILGPYLVYFSRSINSQSAGHERQL